MPAHPIDRPDSCRDDGSVSEPDRGANLTRRAFLSGSALALAGLATPSIALGREGELRGNGKRVGYWRKKRYEGEPTYPLRLPAEMSSDLSVLTAAPALADMGDGRLRRVLAYNGEFPGPTWNARTGDWITVRLQNGLKEDTITHWHGLKADFQNDGGPRLHVHPGGAYDYNFQIVRRAGFAFYHPHPHGLTGKQVALGLAGGIVVRDNEEDTLRLPSGEYEIPLVIRDANFDGQGNLTYNPTLHGYLGRYPLVNGTLSARMSVDRGVYRFRVLNGANARVFRLALSNGAAFTIIGNDGGLLRSPATASSIVTSPGERLDLLVDFRAIGRGQTVALRCLSAGWNLVQFVGSGAIGRSYTPPQTLSVIPALAAPSRPTRTFSFDGTSRINGLSYETDRLDFRVPFGTVERWRFTTRGSGPHPVHVHGAFFQVLSRIGGRGQVFPWERGWKDTVLLQDFETVDVLIQFTDHRGEYDGQYVMHCHLLEHEDQGMMMNFVVI